MVKLPNDELKTASDFAELTGTSPWYTIGTYNLALQYAGVGKRMDVELVHERSKGLEGALGVLGKNGAVMMGPEISAIAEDNMAVLLSDKFKEASGSNDRIKWRSFRIQNNDSVREVLSGVVAYRLTLPQKGY